VLPKAARLRGLVAGLALAGCCCATASLPPPAAILAQARAAATYSGSLRVQLKGPSLRARTRALVAFQRPDALRIEIPGPAGVRLIAVTRQGGLTAVFPGERAVYEGSASSQELEALLGLRLTPAEVMDLLTGTRAPEVRAYEAHWGPALPRQIQATLPDGGRLKVDVDSAEAGLPVPALAFEAPAHDGYRSVSAEEARSLWGGR